MTNLHSLQSLPIAARWALWALALCLAAVPWTAWAQPSGASASVRDIDRILVLVNSEPITSADVRLRMAQLQAPPGVSLPPPDELARQVLERLIIERTQIQRALEIGIRVEESDLNEAEAAVAQQNQLSVADLHQRLRGMGTTPALFRANLRNELLLQRVREREVQGRVRVTELDIDGYLRLHAGAAAPEHMALHLAHILVAAPASPDNATVERLQARAEELARRARAGEDFAALARAYSDGPERAQGGQMGLRSADRYPPLFLQAINTLRRGDLAGPVRSGAGWHILKVLEMRNTRLPEESLTQTRARHILLRPTPELNEQLASQRLAVLRERITTGRTSFEAAAREFSQDGSARVGGDLGWAGPGQFVPEFEQAMNRLAPGEVSAPVRTRFGVHLVQVLERREVAVPLREQREWVRNVLREQKAEQAYEEWARELRARAFVEYRENGR